MSKKIGFLIFFVVLLGLGSTVQAALLPVVNGSFEEANDGSWLPDPCSKSIWDVCDVGQGGWKIRDTTGWASGWNFVTSGTWGKPPVVGYEAVDGNAVYSAITWCDYNDVNGISEIYQILDATADSNVTLAAYKRYTLTFNALNAHEANNPVAYGELYYSNAKSIKAYNDKTAEANDIKLASVSKVLTSPQWNKPDYAGFEELEAEYIVLNTSNPNIGKNLGVKISVPFPWYNGAYVAIDNVRVAWSWLSNAYSPIPADGAGDVSAITTLKWKPGLWAKSTAKKGGHEVYFGNTFADVNSATTATTGIFKAATDANNYDPCTGNLVLGKTYYWRVDEVNAGYGGTNPPPPPGGKWKGDVWSFTVEGRVRNPYPADGAKNVPRNVLLQWVAGAAVKYHDVYFGTSASTVEAATTATSGIYKTRLNKGTEEYDTSSLSLKVAKRYFWRIDEVNTMTVKGYVWDFRVVDFMLIDDFEFYVSDTALTNKWKAVNTSTAYILLNKNATWANGDGNSMQLEYSNDATPWRSHARRTYSTPQDWSYTGNNVTLMELSYYGDVHNFPDGNAYVELYDGTNTKRVYSPLLVGTTIDANVPWAEPWQHVWNIPLNNFTGVNRSNIKSILIGVGDGSGIGGKTEKGTFYFDDIKLWPPRCLPAMIGEANLHNVADLTTAHHGGGDCITDYEDLRLMVERDWLLTAPIILTPDSPDTNGLLWYKFDEGSGTIAKNSGTLGTTFNGVLSTVSGPAWTTDAHDGNALDFTSPSVTTGDYVNLPENLGVAGTNDFTIALWFKAERSLAGEWDFPVLVESRKITDDTDATGFGFCRWGELCYWWNDAYWDWHSGIWPDVNVWTFAAVTIEPTQANLYVSEYGSNSIQKVTHTAEHGLLTDFTTGFHNVIGFTTNTPAAHWDFDGKIDDVHIYDRDLTIEEISYLAGATQIPMEDWRADINNDDAIDLTDYAILANNWLKRLLWPMP